MTALKIILLTAIIFLVFFLGLKPNISFKHQVQPIFQASCIECHSGTGEGSERSGLVLDSYASVMRGTKNGPVIVAGSPASSTLYLAIDHQLDSSIQMPPHHDDHLSQGTSKPLTSEQIKVIKEWIEEGAQDN
ncbi:c-type cytochrome domain-containing protein [uncultured Shewanella sp.]|uniref:c-type cytochrome domain-containing protein n=1 Tax=uncultured Shewanella sp. TaxID=173975 RepID=UPI00262130F2|nr:c-type cytochrome domain-containing protein [uncultured Shewanella sp.]